MSTVAKLGNNSRMLRLNDASPPTWDEVLETRSFVFGSRSDLVEVTHTQSVRKEYILGLPDGIEFTIPINWNPNDAVHLGLQDDQFNNVQRDFRLEISNGDSPDTGVYYDFTGLVLGLELNLQPNEARTQNVTIKPTGAFTRYELP